MAVQSSGVPREIVFYTRLGVYAGMLWESGRMSQHAAFWIGDVAWHS